MRDLDDQEGGERLPRQLRDWRDAPDQAVLVSGEVCGFLQSEDCPVSEDRLVQDLEEVDPDEDGEDDLIRLAANAFVLCVSSATRMRTRLVMRCSYIFLSQGDPLVADHTKRPVAMFRRNVALLRITHSAGCGLMMPNAHLLRGHLVRRASESRGAWSRWIQTDGRRWTREFIVEALTLVADLASRQRRLLSRASR